MPAKTLGLFVVVFALAKTAIWCATFIGTRGALMPVVGDLPALMTTELIGAVIAVGVVQIWSRTSALRLGLSVGVSQLIVSGLIELGRASRIDLDWPTIANLLGVATVTPGWIVTRSWSDGGIDQGYLWLPVVMLLNPLISCAIAILALRHRARRVGLAVGR